MAFLRTVPRGVKRYAWVRPRIADHFSDRAAQRVDVWERLSATGGSSRWHRFASDFRQGKCRVRWNFTGALLREIAASSPWRRGVSCTG